MLLVALTLALTAASALIVHHPLALNLPVAALAAVLALRGHRSLAMLVAARAVIAAVVLGLVPGDVAITVLLWFLRLAILGSMATDLLRGHRLAVTAAGVLLATSVIFDATWVGDTYVTRSPALILWWLGYSVWRLDVSALNDPPWQSRLRIAVIAAPIVYSLWSAEPGLWWAIYGASVLLGRMVAVTASTFLEAALAAPPAPVAGKVAQRWLCAATAVLCLLAAVLR